MLPWIMSGNIQLKQSCLIIKTIRNALTKNMNTVTSLNGYFLSQDYGVWGVPVETDVYYYSYHKKHHAVYRERRMA